MRSKLVAGGVAAIAVAALVATPVVSEAAGQITGKQIKNNSVTGKDIKNGTLSIDDLSSASVAQLKGNSGPAGPAGPTGATGASAFAPPPAGTVVKGGGVLSVTVSGATPLRNYSELPITTTSPLVDDAAGQSVFFGAGTAFPGASDVNATRCPGTFVAPSATPGTLCVYVGGTSNMQAGTGDLFAGASNDAADGADSSGFYVFGSSNAAGLALVRYSWAYTAN